VLQDVAQSHRAGPRQQARRRRTTWRLQQQAATATAGLRNAIGKSALRRGGDLHLTRK